MTLHLGEGRVEWIKWTKSAIWACSAGQNTELTDEFRGPADFCRILSGAVRGMEPPPGQGHSESALEF